MENKIRKLKDKTANLKFDVEFLKERVCALEKEKEAKKEFQMKLIKIIVQVSMVIIALSIVYGQVWK
ncbi:hypothetical protein [uncultured Tenacibaculum sp.]|uniref:hypothetical protein n=1 Tax=uncultured Tenacibaculum sp. TaxID=174713 RepID=UPI0026261114|nr:hypothetical protein [uncultured Tenacibaculum sp.]